MADWLAVLLILAGDCVAVAYLMLDHRPAWWQVLTGLLVVAIGWTTIMAVVFA